MDNIYCPIRAVIRNRTQGSLAYPTAALLRSLQWGSDGRSRYAEPMGRWEVCYAPQRRCFAACSGFRTVGPASRNLGGVGGIARPTAALLRSLQWVSEGRSRVAEPVGRWEIRYVMCEMRSAMCRCAVSCVSCAVSWRDTSI